MIDAKKFKKLDNFLNVIGAIDRTHILFHDGSASDFKLSYWLRKQRYLLNMQATTNYLGLFTIYYIGWPGSCYDRKLFNELLIPEQ